MLLDQLSDDPVRDRSKLQLVQAPMRNDLLHQVTHGCGAVITRGALSGGRDQLRQAVGYEVVLIGSLLRDHRFDEDAEAVSIATALGLDEVEKQVRTRHGLPPSVARRHLLPTLPARAPRLASLADTAARVCARRPVRVRDGLESWMTRR
ncbi:hypothetical protein BN11_4520002 [Nostocoides australiense Ben110]|uniref:Uncharacterized protein n=1 Tax=Nostocoides australiense Ben110 TaxID=1193182 RepID=W6K0E5_9MICO|nr:hypothetical protein BN11_4520002 [Tetrasphaera australiensis Ben110]